MLERVNGREGEANVNAVLTVELVELIKADLAAGENCNRLARKYGVAYTTIYTIKNGTSWKHVATPELTDRVKGTRGNAFYNRRILEAVEADKELRDLLEERIGFELYNP